MIGEDSGSYAGVRTRVLTVAGDDPPIVLLHGFADSADTWLGVLDCLERSGRRGIAVDLPGFGTAEPRAPGPILQQLDRFVNALIEDLGEVVLAGNSLGSATAIRAATRHPAAVRAVIAIDDPINVDHAVARFARRGDRRLLFRALAGLPVPRPLVRVAVRSGARRALYGPRSVPDPTVIDRWIDAIPDMRTAARLGHDAFRYAGETAGGHGQPAVECPVLVMHGARDVIIPVSAGRSVHESISGSEFVVLPSHGHCPQLDDPVAITRLITDFLKRSTSGPSHVPTEAPESHAVPEGLQ